MMQPAYGYIDDPLAAEYPGSPLQRAMKRQIISLNWVYFFGPEYVDQYWSIRGLGAWLRQGHRGARPWLQGKLIVR